MSAKNTEIIEIQDKEDPTKTWGVNLREVKGHSIYQLVDIWFNTDVGGQRISRCISTKDLEELLNLRLNEV